MSKKKSVRILKPDSEHKSIRVRYYENGKPKSLSFPSELDALAFKKTFEAEFQMPADIQIPMNERIDIYKLRNNIQENAISWGKVLDLCKDYKRKALMQHVYTLKELTVLYMSMADKSNNRPSTKDNKLLYVNKIIQYFGADFQVADITTDDLDAFIISSKSADHLLPFVKHLFSIAKKLKIFKDNIAIDIKLPVIRNDKESPKIESVDNIIRILAALDKKVLPAYVLLTFAGLRPEEVSAKKNGIWMGDNASYVDSLTNVVLYGFLPEECNPNSRKLLVILKIADSTNLIQDKVLSLPDISTIRS